MPEKKNTIGRDLKVTRPYRGLKLLKNPGNGRLNNLNDPVLNVLSPLKVRPLNFEAKAR